MDENNAINVVENLIETNKDAQKGYQDAAEHVKRPDLKSYFNEQSVQRGRFAQELQAELAKLGSQRRKYPAQSVARCIGPGSIPRQTWAAAIKRSWSRLSQAKITPRTPTRKRSRERCPAPCLRSFGGRQTACSVRMITCVCYGTRRKRHRAQFRKHCEDRETCPHFLLQFQISSVPEYV